MSNVKRWAHTVTWEGLQISAAYMAINDGGEYVMHADYAALEAERERLADALDRQSVITGDYIARCQRLADELAITRRVIDRIGQLCTTPHESKERFIRRVQSVIEWERAAQQDQPK